MHLKNSQQMIKSLAIKIHIFMNRNNSHLFELNGAIWMQNVEIQI